MFFLITLGANIDLPCLSRGMTMLLDTCQKGYIDFLEFLLKHGANIEAKDHGGRNIGDHMKSEFNGKTPDIRS
jgi:ankyrin repeat protein